MVQLIGLIDLTVLNGLLTDNFDLRKPSFLQNGLKPFAFKWRCETLAMNIVCCLVIDVCDLTCCFPEYLVWQIVRSQAQSFGVHKFGDNAQGLVSAGQRCSEVIWGKSADIAESELSFSQCSQLHLGVCSVWYLCQGVCVCVCVCVCLLYYGC